MPGREAASTIAATMRHSAVPQLDQSITDPDFLKEPSCVSAWGLAKHRHPTMTPPTDTPAPEIGARSGHLQGSRLGAERGQISMLFHNQASNLAEEMAFFAYSEFLRQVSRPFLLSMSEGVHEEPTEREGRMEIRDGQGLPIWRFERKLTQRDGELSLEPARIRNHRNFDAAAREDNFGLGGLQAANEVEHVAAGYQRTYLFPEQDCGLTRNAKVKLSAETGHGGAKIVALDAERSSIVIEVPHDFKRLLSNCIALIGSAHAAKPTIAKPETRRATAKTKTKERKA